MDRRVAKDMISSGMIPSGEKKKEDLGRPQYGTVPSPNALADAYKSMYDKKEEVINEHHKKDADGNTIPHEGEELNEVSKKTLSSYVKKASTEIGTSAIKGDYKKMQKRHKGVLDASDKMAKEEIDTYDIVLDHFLNEGYQREDIIKAMSTVHLTEEQLLQEDFGISALIAGTAAALAKGAAVAGKVAAVGGKVAGAAAKGGMAAAKGIGGATKGIVSAAKPVASAATKGLTQVGKTAADVGSKGVKAAGDVVKKGVKSAGDVSQQVKKVATTAKDNVGQKIQNIAQGTKPQSKQLQLDLGNKNLNKPSPTTQTTQTPQQKTVKQKVIDYGKRKAREKAEQELFKDRPVGKTNKTGVSHAGQTDIAASADLFDIVKGRLLDEGLSEEEIKDIMLTLTADEIMEELSDIVKRNDAINKANAMKRAKEREVPQNVRDAQKRQTTAGGPKDKGENKYTTQDKKTIIDYHKNRESM